MGAVCATIRRCGGRSGYVLFFHLRILSPRLSDRSALFSKEEWLGLVANDLRRVAHHGDEERLRRFDVQYAASGWAAVSSRHFHCLLPAKRPRPGTGVPKLGTQPAL